MKTIRVKDMMVRKPIFVSPKTSLKEAAAKMKKENCGVLPVGTPEKLEGIITDRDLVIRALINNEHAHNLVKDYMTPEIIFCHENDTLEKAANIMQKNEVNRLMVKDESGKYTGLLSFGDTLRYRTEGKEIAEIVERSCHRRSC